MSTETQPKWPACPSWCTVSVARHMGDRAMWEEEDLHEGVLLASDYGQAGRVSNTVYISGQGNVGDPYRVHADIHPDASLTPAQARVVAAALMSAADAIEGSHQ